MLDMIWDEAPLALLGLLLFGAMILFAMAGARLRHQERDKDGDNGAEGYLLSATLALLGLLIAFTFSLSLSRYDSRREMIVAEGNAIGTAWLRAGLVEGSQGKALQDSIRTYAAIRLRLPERGHSEAVERESAAAQARVWALMKAGLTRTPPPIGAAIVSATNEMFDAASSRRAEREARIPGRVLNILCLYALISAGIVGYVMVGSGRRHRLVTGVLFLLLSLAILLILDLDRPWSGSIVLSQEPIVRAYQAMR